MIIIRRKKYGLSPNRVFLLHLLVLLFILALATTLHPFQTWEASAQTVHPTLEMSVDKTGASADSVLTYTIRLAASFNMSEVWINDTLDPSVNYIETLTSIPPSVSNNTLSWHVTNVTSPLEISFTVSVDNQIVNAAVIENRATTQYSNETGISSGGIIESNEVTTTIGTVMLIRKTTQRTEANVGDKMQYRIEYENLGGGEARDVWINDTLPQSLTFISTSNRTYHPFSFEFVPGEPLHWHFTDVSQGIHYIEFTVEVNENAKQGSRIYNEATLVYTDGQGHFIESLTSERVGTVVGEEKLDFWPLLIMVVGFAFIISILLLVISTRKLLSSLAYKAAKGSADIIRTTASKVKRPSTVRKNVKKRKDSTKRPKPRHASQSPPPPSSNKAKGSAPQSHEEITEGDSCLVIETTPDHSYSMFKAHTSKGFEGIVISRTHPDKIHTSHSIAENVPVFWLSRTEGESSIAPNRVERILYVVNDFLNKNEKVVILLDGLEYLSVHNSFSKITKFIQNLNEKVVLKKSILIMPINPQALSSENLAILEREMKCIHRTKSNNQNGR